MNNHQVKAFAAGMLAATLLIFGVACETTPGGTYPDRPLYVHCDNVK